MAFIYLASPYSHANPVVQEKRMYNVSVIAAQLLAGGATVISPVAHAGAFLGEACIRDQSHNFWMKHALNLLDVAESLYIACLPGWQESRGLSEEVRYATMRGIDIFLVTNENHPACDFVSEEEWQDYLNT